MRQILTHRLVLEPVTTANAGTLWKIMQSGNLREFQDVPRYRREEFERRVAGRPKSFDSRAFGRFEWLLVLAATREPIGWVSLRVGDHTRGTAEVGYSLLAKYRGSGFASEATRGVVDYAFSHGDLRELDACCVPANLPSRRLLERIGFLEMRIQKHGAIVRGRPVDVVTFELPRERWERMREPSSHEAAGDGYAGSANSIVMPASAKPK